MPKLAPEEHAIKGAERRVKSIEARIEILKAERDALLKLIRELKPAE